MSHSKPRLISVGWSMTNSPGLTLFPFSAALALSQQGNRFRRKSAAKQVLNHHFVFFIATFRDSWNESVYGPVGRGTIGLDAVDEIHRKPNPVKVFRTRVEKSGSSIDRSASIRA